MLVLASSSPRRMEILSRMEIPFRTVVRPVDEAPLAGETVAETAVRLSRMKAEAVLDVPDDQAFGILGADTLIEFDGTVIGKPKDEREAERFLRSYSGKTHRVITGVTLFTVSDRRFVSSFDATEVRFGRLSDGEIGWYLRTGEWKDAAGGYKIQAKGGCLIELIVGSYSNVMGLPIRLIYGMLRDNNYPFI